MSDMTVEKILNETEKALRRYLLECCDENLYSLSLTNILRRDFSTVYFLEGQISSGVKKFVLKQIVHAPINLSITQAKNQAVVEYEILAELSPAFQDVQGCGVPCPLLVLPELEAFLMEFIEGAPLSEYLRYARLMSGRKNFQALARYFYLCGKWLKNFQNITGVNNSSSSVFDGLLSRCNDRLKVIEEKAASFRIPTGFSEKIFTILNSKIDSLGEQDIQVAGRHGDFGHWNIMVHERDIVVFDLMGYEKEPIAYDLAKIALSLEYWKFHFAYSSARLNLLKKEFIDGYGGILGICPEVLQICEIYHRVANIYSIVSNVASRIDKRIMRERFLRENIFCIEKYEGSSLWIF